LLILEASAFWESREVSTVTALLSNKAYGYPTRGARRRRKPTIFACLHQTANAEASAMHEHNYANRAGSWGPSATAYIDRDGMKVGDTPMRDGYLRGLLSRTPAARQVDVLAAFVAAAGR
jgi:hypothetical protein